ncbi:MAG: phytase [Fibrobacterota bacterium]
MSNPGLFFLSLSILVTVSFSGGKGDKPCVPLTAVFETEPVGSSEDAADDPCIFYNEKDPAASVIIGTNKNRKKGGLGVYDLKGNLVSFAEEPAANNVDIRKGLKFKGKEIPVIAASSRHDNSVVIYTYHDDKKELELLARAPAGLREPYGLAMYHNPQKNRFYYIVNDKEGKVVQWEIMASGDSLKFQKTAEFKVETQTEGCVVDDSTGFMYLGEEERGVWKINLLKTEDYVLIDSVTGEGNLVADVEGITLLYNKGKKGYLIVSSQGNTTYHIYERDGNNRHLGCFSIADSEEGIDGTYDTDGIDVLRARLNDDFTEGIFVAQDGDNSPENQNFKYIRLGDILEKVIGKK